ncbi:ankyrin repeat domain-containing protein [Arcobacter sp. CECT 8985]|uniref:ankyrin repeat domain-containing protein n=1 Tax=Arcobacter sp. CECT 8985 TaxID=1935424 RepID=UPI00100AD744|nr:ankyrin repeat domain-containing protein [Arcobacter sp. CECT 8985]RXJ87088.1 hypothetical protein CRU93_05815 [Arcobacter sp. CECT 8985]
MSRNVFLTSDEFCESLTIKKLLHSNHDVNYQDKDGWCVLFESIANNENIEALISLGANINIRDKKGRNALYWAMYHKNSIAVKKLIKLGINLYVTPTLFALHYAVYNDDVKMLKSLKSSGLDINFLDSINATPFIYSVLYNRVQCFDYLLKNGADIYQSDILGNSAYTLAKDLKIDKILTRLEQLETK